MDSRNIGAVTKKRVNEVLNSGVIKPEDGQFQTHVGTERVNTAFGIPKSVAMLMGGDDSSDGSSTSEDSDFEAKRAPILKPKHKILPHVKRLNDNGARPLDKEKTKGIGTNCTKYNPYTKPRLNKKVTFNGGVTLSIPSYVYTDFHVRSYILFAIN